jgi:putative DNA methylase
MLKESLAANAISLPDLSLEDGYNTRQSLGYGFVNWRDFFNDRHLLALGWLQSAIATIDDESTRRALFTLFSGVLEFNNLFASYKGEGTGAVRHMFAHHILKPERVPIEANPWGTSKSSGSFLNLFRSRLLRALDYRDSPTEIYGVTGHKQTCSEPITGSTTSAWQFPARVEPRHIYLSCGDSAASELPDECVDLVVTDPPFFDNVHYAELADFFFAWQRLRPHCRSAKLHSTRHHSEVQDTDAKKFAAKLCSVFCECYRVLKSDGLLVFSYHHSREEGWHSLAEAIFGAGFSVVNAHPVKAEMSVATPKSQAKDPIQLDVILVCRKHDQNARSVLEHPGRAIARAWAKLARLANEGFELSASDRKVAIRGQLLATLSDPTELSSLEASISEAVSIAFLPKNAGLNKSRQIALFNKLE